MTPWTVAHQIPLSMEFSRQVYWSGLPFPSSGDLPNPGLESRCAALQADSSPSELPGKTNNSKMLNKTESKSFESYREKAGVLEVGG